MPEPAPPPLSDAPDRAKMASALDENVVLLAGAGAGKTYAPVEQMVATIREGVEAVDHLAAITSTRRSSISSMKRHRPSPIPAGAGRRSPFSSF